MSLSDQQYRGRGLFLDTQERAPLFVRAGRDNAPQRVMDGVGKSVGKSMEQAQDRRSTATWDTLADVYSS